MPKKKLVIIGNGMAGARLVSEILARGGSDAYQITLFGDEPGGSYNRILLSEVLNGSKSPESIVLHPLEWYADNGLKLHAGQRVVAVDLQRRCVTSDNGTVEEYDAVVFATGSRALVPPMDGLKTPDGARKRGVFVMRTLRDCAQIAGYVGKAKRAAVIGGGLLGLEAARGLMEHGARVDLVHRSGCLMSAQLDAASGALLRSVVEKLGIAVHLDKQTSVVAGDEAATGLEFSDGSRLPCDLVVVACGISPNVELARASGLPVEKAVVVDDQLRAAEGVFALGECAQHRGEVYGLVAPIWEQCRVLADVLVGKGGRYEGSKLAVKLKVMGVELASMGRTREREGDEVVCYQEPHRGRYKKLIIRDGRLAGAILLGDTRKSATLTQFFDRQMPLPEERASLFFDIGKGGSGGGDAKSLPDEATVCNCNSVAAGQIRSAIKGGATDLPALMSATRAGTGCGGCKSLVREFLMR